MGSGMLVIWVLLGLCFALLVRYTMDSGNTTKHEQGKSALDIL